MSVIYKDIDQLSQKSTMAGTEKIPVSDTQYITPAQIVANSLPLAGGSMDSDAYISFPDYDNEYNAAVTYDGLHAERTYNSVRYKLDATPNYVAVFYGNDHARYRYDSILRRLNGTDYNINLPSAAGTLALTSNIPSTLDQITDGSTRKLSNYLPLAGGTMNDDAEVEFTDGESRTVTITPDTIDLHSSDDAWRVVLDPSNPGMTVGDDDFSSYTLYRQDGITNKTNSSTYYNIGFPNKNGTFALTSDIPSAVTESTVSGWGFTKNTGTYSKPSGGIPSTDLASAVQTSLGKADTALQSFTETDPVFSASAAAGITSSDITNWNNIVTGPQGYISESNGVTGIMNSNGSFCALPEMGDGNEDCILATTDQIPTVPTNVSAFTNDANYVKYVLCADEAAYNAIANKDSGTLYLIPKTS